MIVLTNCSGVVLDRNQGCWMSGGFPVTLTGCSGFSINHCTLVNTTSGVIKATDSSGIVVYSIVGSSGASLPIESVTQPIIATSSNIFDYNLIGSGFLPHVSGTPSAVDPLLTDVANCDLRLRATSPLAAAAEPIPEFIDVQVLDTEFTHNSVKFYSKDLDGVSAGSPSGMYVVQNGKALFIPNQNAGMEEDMDIVVNVRYIVRGDTTVVSSHNIEDTEEGKSDQYPFDYKIVPRKNYRTNKDEFFLMPYSVIPLQDILGSQHVIKNITTDDVEVSGLYQFNALSYDSVIHDAGNLKVYWVSEVNNGYLYKYSSDSNELLETYLLYPPNPDASGNNKTVKPADFQTLSSYNGGARVLTTKFVDREEVVEKEKILDLNDKNQEIQWYPADLNNNLKPLALLDVDDYLYVLTKNVIEPSGTEDRDVSIDMFVYNKFEREFPKLPHSVISGVVPSELSDPTDMTIDDQGNVYISISGRVDKYQSVHDYALVTRTPGTIKSTVIFRELYNEVNL